MTTDYDEFHAPYNDNHEEYNNEADVKLEDRIVQTEDIPESKAGIAQSVSLENIKSESLDQQLDDDVGDTENYKKKCGVDAKFEDCLIETEDFLVSKAEISLSDDNGAVGISSENIKVEKKAHNFNGIPDRAQCGKSDNVPFTCTICQKSFAQRSKLLLHIKRHTAKKRFSCEICEKSFSEKGAITAHIKTHTGEKPFTCDVCNKSFSRKGNLATHTRLHTGEKPFGCEICKKSFCTKRLLETHTITHTGEKPYACNICKKSFSQKSGLTIHNRTHTGERPFTCQICFKSFAQRSTLVSHESTHY